MKTHNYQDFFLFYIFFFTILNIPNLYDRTRPPAKKGIISLLPTTTESTSRSFSSVVVRVYSYKKKYCLLQCAAFAPKHKECSGVVVVNAPKGWR